MTRFLIDPGHGGTRDLADSSAGGVRWGRLLEKNLTLDLALKVKAQLSDQIILTRTDDRELTGDQRAALARRRKPEWFLSLHINQSDDPTISGPEIWAHRDAEEHVVERIARLAQNLETILARPCPVYLGPLSALDPTKHDPATTPCSLELGYLSNVADREKLADTNFWARTISSLISPAASPVDTWHEVPLVYQRTGMSCWAAAAAMIVGWRDLLDVDGEDVVRAAGAWEAYREGLEPRDVEALAEAFDLLVEEPRHYSVQALHEMLVRYGPLWVGEASPGLHVVVVAGMRGDGTADGTWVYVVDPWPVGRGERYRVRFRELAANLSAVEALTGFRAQILHARSAVHRGR